MIRGELDRIQNEQIYSERSNRISTIRKFSLTDLDTTEDRLFDQSNESESTVIHYDDNKLLYKSYLDLNTVSLLPEPNLEKSSKCSDLISKFTNYLGYLTYKYIEQTIASRKQTLLEVRSSVEEFQFDMISCCMNLSRKSDHRFGTLNNSIEDREISINLSKTPYPLLLHSLRPQLISFSLLSFTRRYFKQITLKNVIDLIILSITTLNMSNNSLIGMKIYVQMMIHRTKHIIDQLLHLEDYFSNISGIMNTTSYRRHMHRSLNSKFNLVNSSMHFLISLLVNRIGRLTSFGLNNCTLMEYITIYGIEDELEETKIVKNIAKTTSSCSCTWYNEPNRILQTLKYTRKILICTLMSSIEIENNTRTTLEYANAESFLRSFWNRLGIYTNFDTPHVMISTKILGIANELKSMSLILAKINEEVVDEKLLDSFDSVIDMDLAVVSERNEDDTVYELSQMIEKLSTKLDLIELGKTDFKLVDLKDDMFEFFSYYNETTFGKSTTNDKRDTSSLRRIRMSEILFDDENKKVAKEKRRSSGMNFPIVSVVKNEDLISTTEDDNHNTQNEEFQRVLEKLCSKKGSATNEVNV